MKESKVLSVIGLAAKILLLVWLIVKAIAVFIPLIAHGDPDLTVINPGIEAAFDTLIFAKGLALFIVFVVITSLGYPLSYLIAPDSRIQNIIGFFAYALLILKDVISVFILSFSDKWLILTLALNALMIGSLLIYGKRYLLPGGDDLPKESQKKEETTGETEQKKTENNP